MENVKIESNIVKLTQMGSSTFLRIFFNGQNFTFSVSICSKVNTDSRLYVCGSVILLDVQNIRSDFSGAYIEETIEHNA